MIKLCRIPKSPIWSYCLFTEADKVDREVVTHYCILYYLHYSCKNLDNYKSDTYTN